MQLERLDADGHDILTTNPLQYHIERSIKGANWGLVLTFASRARAIVKNPGAGFNPERYEATRFEDDGDGSAPRVYDGLGRIIPNQAPAGMGGGVGTATLLSSIVQSAFGGGSRRAASDRSWVSSFVLRQTDSPARAAAFRQKYGSARVNAAGNAEYTARHDSATTTIEVDSSSQTIVAMHELIGAKPGRSWAITYDRAPDGTATKREIRVVLPNANGLGSRVMVTRFSNVQFERRGL